MKQHNQAPSSPHNDTEQPIWPNVDIDTLPPLQDAVISSSRVSEETSRPTEQHNTPVDTAEPLGSFSIREEVGIDWDSLEKVVPKSAKEHIAEQAKQWGEFTPAVAEAVVRQYEPSTEPFEYMPTAAQIKERRPGLRAVSRVLGFFSSKWASRFDRYLEKKAQEYVMQVASRAREPIDTIGSFDAPKEQFLNEVEMIYREVQESKDIVADPTKLQVSPRLLRDKYPLLGNAAPLFNDPSKHKANIQAFAPEIMRGIEQFLKKHSRNVETIDFAPYNSKKRENAKQYMPGMLDILPNTVEESIARVYDILPEDGKKFTNEVRALCKKITEHARKGDDPSKITQALLKSLWR